jgi:NAD(P)-dependent dehydrogenase (short-subunit alcohol dehydrogenase family)
LNQTVAITGGARGIGAATARAFAKRGARVAIGDLDEELAQKTAQEIANETGASVAGFGLDVTDGEAFGAFLDEVEDVFGALDVLVNNAGIMPTGNFLDDTDTMSDRQIDINIRGVITGSRLAGRRFAAQGSGQIVNIASMAGLVAAPGIAVYAATKHAVVGLGSALYQELAPQGVVVTTIAPSFVKTELIAGLTPNWFIRQIGVVEPEVIASAIVDCVEKKHGGLRAVPGRSAAILRALSPFPEDIKNVVARVTGMQSVMLKPDASARAKYLDRAETGH